MKKKEEKEKMKGKEQTLKVEKEVVNYNLENKDLIHKQSPKGITLVALVITIIVLLILSGVTIMTLFGENGLISMAERVKSETENAQANTIAEIDSLINELNSVLNGSDTESNLISFTINGTSYPATSGMTWTQWLASDYNTGSYTADMDVKDDNGNIIDKGTPINAEGKYEIALPPVVAPAGATFNDGTTLSWEELKLAENGETYGYNASAITDTSIEIAFCECTSLTSITIPNSVTSIGETTFAGCTSLTSITIGNGVTSIGYYAFDSCSSLTSITIPDSVTSIGQYSFAGCTSFTSVTIPDSVTSIGESAFYGCTSLTSITIPDSVTSIGNCAFERCTSLTGINVDTNNPNHCSENGVLYNKNKTCLIQYPAGKTGASFVIPNSVTSIGESAFQDCTSFTSVGPVGSGASVEIPDSVTSIGEHVFSECTSLTSITIPDSVTSISYGAFSECTSLTSITIGNSVTSIGDSAFSGCSALASVTIPASVTSIGQWVFYDCTSLTSITYNGTQAQWNAIRKYNDKYSNWKDGIPSSCTVTFSDGTSISIADAG